MSQPRHIQWTTTKHVLRYLQSKVGYGLRYASSIDLNLQGYADEYWAKEYSGPEEHIQLLFYLGVFHGFLVQQVNKSLWP
jgi:hypothetical protein